MKMMPRLYIVIAQITVPNLPSDISGNLRHDHWHDFKWNGGRVKCFARTRFSMAYDLLATSEGQTCLITPFAGPPPRHSPMPDYPPKL